MLDLTRDLPLLWDTGFTRSPSAYVPTSERLRRTIVKLLNVLQAGNSIKHCLGSVTF